MLKRWRLGRREELDALSLPASGAQVEQVDDSTDDHAGNNRPADAEDPEVGARGEEVGQRQLDQNLMATSQGTLPRQGY